MKNVISGRPIQGLLFAAGLALATVSQAATVLSHESISILNSGGSGGSGASTSDMVYPVYGSDGWGWAGGAGGVQGGLSVTNTGGLATAANEAFKFNVGSLVDSLNTTHGAGNWTIDNLTLNFNSSYKLQNNSRFGRGSGTYDVYWVGNDGWAQSKGTAGDKQLNPVYASNLSDLHTWAGSESLLGSYSFNLVAGSDGYVNITLQLGETSAFVQDILTASAAGSNKAASLYLMGTSDTLGMIIFTGGQGQSLPTLSFDVLEVDSVPTIPEPSSWALLAAGALVLPRLRRRRR